MTNATKNLDASRHEVINKLIDYNSKQNELIFATRERLFKLEQTQNKDARILCAMNIVLGGCCLLMCLQFGGYITW